MAKREIVLPKAGFKFVLQMMSSNIAGQLVEGSDSEQENAMRQQAKAELLGLAPLQEWWGTTKEQEDFEERYQLMKRSKEDPPHPLYQWA